MRKFLFLKDPLFYLAIFLAAVFLVVFIGVFQNSGLKFEFSNLSYSITFLLKFVVLFPLLEEYVFRGWFQDSLLQKKKLSTCYMGISYANLIVSIIFSALHLIEHTLLFIPGIFISSLVFGFFYERHQSVIPSIVLHSIYNVLFLVLIR